MSVLSLLLTLAYVWLKTEVYFFLIQSFDTLKCHMKTNNDTHRQCRSSADITFSFV